VAQTGPEVPELKVVDSEEVKVERHSVSSSTLRAVGYDRKTLTLEVEFLNGNIYQYFDVPEVVHEEFIRAASHGQFLSQQIKGHFRYAKL
jgi:KTSC domain